MDDNGGHRIDIMNYSGNIIVRKILENSSIGKHSLLASLHSW